MQNIDLIIKTHCEQLPTEEAFFNWNDVKNILANGCKASFRLGQHLPRPDSKPAEDTASDHPGATSDCCPAKGLSLQSPISDSVVEAILKRPIDKRECRLPEFHLLDVKGIFDNPSVNAIKAANNWVEKIGEDLETLEEEVCNQSLTVPPALLDQLQTKLEALEDEVINLHNVHMPTWSTIRDESATAPAEPRTKSVQE